MENLKQYDVIIIGGSYAGLAAAMSLGRALKHTLVIDSGKPCNRQTPYSHNFLGQDGKTPKEIASLARQQVAAYPSIRFLEGIARSGKKTNNGFEITIGTGETFFAKKLIFSTGIIDEAAKIEGFEACWGISVLHCPYCHGYEVRKEKTGILGNGKNAYELAVLISNWTDQLTLFTNGKHSFTAEQLLQLKKHKIGIQEKIMERLNHTVGQLDRVVFTDGTSVKVKAIYSRHSFFQQCQIPQILGCEPTEEGYIKVDQNQETSIKGIYACGDCTTKVRTVANSVASGTTAGMMSSKQLIIEEF
ncbi:pyridine nucleotide-disulfide oxidoreductase [Pedobacter sp. PACM 27299]|uniref:NAD(P)/FAD-dependent oxidoreductase n=1 Tax=Pedobacter sp. PACM 27299 TaxID=1727164 RepID=UPI000706D824|nr:NAD(P)/FAD-dependent oxidoreductase [Pedobacter sp. PACM 27299]ALL06488.1 pyridine nucleotide-disulfide oxidoreductase [Pedobacter sp. PACM 27299]